MVVCSCNHKCAEFREIDEVRTEMLSPGEWWQVSENASFGEKLFFGLERVETDFVVVLGSDCLFPKFFFKRIVGRVLKMMEFSQFDIVGSKKRKWGDFDLNETIRSKVYEKPLTKCDYVSDGFLVSKIGVSPSAERLCEARTRKDFFIIAKKIGIRVGVSDHLKFFRN